MSYTSASGREQILDETSAAAEQLDAALGQLGEAYDHLDEPTADRMETDIFRPLQAAAGQLKRAHSEFAARHAMVARRHATAPQTAPHDARTALESAADSIDAADQLLSELQDSMLPVEVGDRELRTALSDVRVLLSPLPAACDRLIRTFGR